MLHNTSFPQNTQSLDIKILPKKDQQIEEEDCHDSTSCDDSLILSSPSLIPDEISDSESSSESLDEQAQENNLNTPSSATKDADDSASPSKKRSKINNKPEKNLTVEDEQVLLKLVVKLKNSWKKIVKRFNKVQNKAVSLTVLRTRYSALAPKVFKRKGKFTHQEDLLLAKYFTEFGSNWDRIAAQLKNRTPNMLKNRYYSHIRKRKLLSELLEELKVNNGNGIINEMVDIEQSTEPSSPGSDEVKSEAEPEIKEMRKIEYENMIFFSMKKDTLCAQTIYIPEICIRLFEIDENEENELHTKITNFF